MKMIKCKICGAKRQDLKGMNAHYKKAHPGHNKKARAATKARKAGSAPAKPKGSRSKSSSGATARLLKVCPHCGGQVED